MKKNVRKFVALSIAVTVLASAQVVVAAATFTDTKTHWAKNEISIAVDQKWINGYDAKTFKPNANMTRAEFLKSLVTAMKIKVADSDTPFVDDTGWFRSFIATGLKNSIIKVGDYKENTFEPNLPITREEIARMTIRALGKDAEGIKSGYLAVAKKLEIMKGYPDGTMGGDKNATRAESVVMITSTLIAKNPTKPVSYPKTKEEMNTLIKSLPNFKGTTTFGDEGIVFINSKASDNFLDNTLIVEYNTRLKMTVINIADPTSDNQLMVKDLLKNYFPKSSEKAYETYIKVNKAANSDANADIRLKYDGRVFEALKASSGKRVQIRIGL
ncbi:S-layer homology domain-containing protein [Paenibacillus sp. PL91]|uniref:S-layer homology domain-containing protein n=1 Tax=Paenibacillus sp. PL91 TaxID=2729538 RepID=UPI00145EBF10|nr:S-layer homology domain-containing protein [Paenibacillus sp. PL91]MBC9204743.1 S-layer homology domain-containing protein [Paenibacillus sp. PL91]